MMLRGRVDMSTDLANKKDTPLIAQVSPMSATASRSSPHGKSSSSSSPVGRTARSVSLVPPSPAGSPKRTSLTKINETSLKNSPGMHPKRSVRHPSLAYNRALLHGLANNPGFIAQAVKTLRENPAIAQKVLQQYRSNKNTATTAQANTKSPRSSVIARQKSNEDEKRSSKVSVEKLETHYHNLDVVSVTACQEVDKVIGMTTIPGENYLAVVHDNDKISIFALVEDWQLHLAATFTTVELDRRQQKHLRVPLDGSIAAMPDQIFVVNAKANRILRFNFELFEAAYSKDAYETSDVLVATVSRSLVGDLLGLAVNVKRKELYTSTGDHIVAYSTDTGNELMRAALVQPPGVIVSFWADVGVCYYSTADDSQNSAIRIKFFNKDNQIGGFDVKITNSKGLFSSSEQGGAIFDQNSGALLVISNDSITALAARASPSCCVTLPSVKIVSSLSQYGITKPIALTTLEPRCHNNNNDATRRKSSVRDHGRSLLVVLDAATSSISVIS